MFDILYSVQHDVNEMVAGWRCVTLSIGAVVCIDVIIGIEKR